MESTIMQNQMKNEWKLTRISNGNWARFVKRLEPWAPSMRPESWGSFYTHGLPYETLQPNWWLVVLTQDTGGDPWLGP